MRRPIVCTTLYICIISIIMYVYAVNTCYHSTNTVRRRIALYSWFAACELFDHVRSRGVIERLSNHIDVNTAAQAHISNYNVTTQAAERVFSGPLPSISRQNITAGVPSHSGELLRQRVSASKQSWNHGRFTYVDFFISQLYCTAKRKSLSRRDIASFANPLMNLILL